MEYGKFRCRECGKLRRRQAQEQRYCARSACQKARKNAWRRAKYAADADYRANQRDSTDAWLVGQGGAAAYHRAYRQRRKAGAGLPKRSPPADSPASVASANSDGRRDESSWKSGVYALTRITRKSDANSDALVVKIDFISTG